ENTEPVRQIDEPRFVLRGDRGSNRTSPPSPMSSTSPASCSGGIEEFELGHRVAHLAGVGEAIVGILRARAPEEGVDAGGGVGTVVGKIGARRHGLAFAMRLEEATRM